MIKINSITERLMYNTIKIETQTGSGTGFFFEFKYDNNVSVPLLITNKHVVNNNENEIVNFHVHLSGANEEPLFETAVVTLETKWYFHPTYDLCCTPIAHLIKYLKEKYEKNMFYIPLSEELILNQSETEELNAQEAVSMIGYPNGLWDKYSKLPIFRKGYTAFHPGIDFNNESLGIVDMACFHGSSGSPIFILNEGLYSNKNGNTVVGNRVMLLGILYSGPTKQIIGDIVETQDLKTVSVSKSLINLGYYIKSRELLYFKSIFETLVKNKE